MGTTKLSYILLKVSVPSTEDIQNKHDIASLHILHDI
jgi:hypothetical protein